MRKLNHLERYRLKSQLILETFGSYGDEYNGIFLMQSPFKSKMLKIIASNGEGWDHVSVSKEQSIPTWQEMSYVKELFFKDDEAVMQLHVPKYMHVNYHPNCLHLWRPHYPAFIPLPPTEMVGPVGVKGPR